jgi:hypothetical protein
MKSPGLSLEKEPVMVWLVPCSWCKEKYKVVVGGTNWTTGGEIGWMTKADAESSFGDEQYQIQEIDSHGICPSCSDKIE